MSKHLPSSPLLTSFHKWSGSIKRLSFKDLNKANGRSQQLKKQHQQKHARELPLNLEQDPIAATLASFDRLNLYTRIRYPRDFLMAFTLVKQPQWFKQQMVEYRGKNSNENVSTSKNREIRLLDQTVYGKINNDAEIVLKKESDPLLLVDYERLDAELARAAQTGSLEYFDTKLCNLEHNQKTSNATPAPRPSASSDSPTEEANCSDSEKYNRHQNLIPPMSTFERQDLWLMPKDIGIQPIRNSSTEYRLTTAQGPITSYIPLSWAHLDDMVKIGPKATKLQPSKHSKNQQQQQQQRQQQQQQQGSKYSVQPKFFPLADSGKLGRYFSCMFPLHLKNQLEGFPNYQVFYRLNIGEVIILQLLKTVKQWLVKYYVQINGKKQDEENVLVKLGSQLSHKDVVCLIGKTKENDDVDVNIFGTAECKLDSTDNEEASKQVLTKINIDQIRAKLKEIYSSDTYQDSVYKNLVLSQIEQVAFIFEKLANESNLQSNGYVNGEFRLRSTDSEPYEMLVRNLIRLGVFLEN